LNRSQRKAVDEIFISREKIVGLDGVAVRARQRRYRLSARVLKRRLPSGRICAESRAAHKLAEAGMETSTLQRYLAKGAQPDTGERRLYVLDESSLASTRQMPNSSNVSIGMIGLLLVGDSRQHEAVEAAVRSRNSRGRDADGHME